MTRTRFRTALTGSIALHAAFAAVVLCALRPAAQIRIESIEVIADAPQAAAAPAARTAPTASTAHAESLSKSTLPVATQFNAAPAATPAASSVNAAVMNSYLSGVREKLSSALRAPRIHSNSPLRVLLKLTLLENGEVQAPSIEQGSGSADFDRAVLEALDRAKPFSHFGPEMASVHQVTLKLPIQLHPRH